MTMTDTIHDGPSFMSFRGRTRRRTYWCAMLAICLPTLAAAGMAVMPVLNAFAHGGMDDPVAVLSKYGYGLLLAFAMAIVAFILLLPISVRRLHDRNMSGWWMLVFLLGGILPYVGCLFGVAQFVIMGCLAGTPGTNRFGSDPKETESTAEKTQL